MSLFESGEKYAQIKYSLQEKKKQSYIKLLVFFDMKVQQGIDFFIGGNNVNYAGSGLKLTP